MQKMPKKMSQLRRYSTVFVLATLCLTLTSCGVLLGDFEYVTTYEQYETNSSCVEADLIGTVTYQTKPGYFSRLSTQQDFFGLPFFLGVSPAFSGEMHLPFVGDDCSYYWSYSQCMGFSWSNFVPISGRVGGAGPVTLNIDFEKDGVEYVGQIHLGAQRVASGSPDPFSAYVNSLWLDETRESSITSYVDGVCDQKIIFTSFSGTKYSP
jgi:hypothetical protein